MAPDCASILGPVMVADKVLYTEHLNIAVFALVHLACMADVTTGTELLELLNATAAIDWAKTATKCRRLRILVHPRPFRGPSLANSMVPHPLNRNRTGV